MRFAGPNSLAGRMVGRDEVPGAVKFQHVDIPSFESRVLPTRRAIRDARADRQGIRGLSAGPDQSESEQDSDERHSCPMV
jgi:hypothetical protein